MKPYAKVPEMREDGSRYLMRYRLNLTEDAPTNLEMWKFIHACNQHDELIELYQLLEMMSGGPHEHTNHAGNV